MRFNTRRCDWRTNGMLRPWRCVWVSIPEGAIEGSDFKTNALSVFTFQYPKVRLKGSPQISYKRRCWSFNTRRCDWRLDLLAGLLDVSRSFNTRRCDWRTTSVRPATKSFSVSIPEGAIEGAQVMAYEVWLSEFQYPKVRLKAVRWAKPTRTQKVSIPEGAIEGTDQVLSKPVLLKVSIPEGAIEGW